MDSIPFSATASRSFRIIPAGYFTPIDGRLKGRSWLLTAENGFRIAAAARQKVSDYLIDYEHQSLTQQEAPAAGWFKTLEYRSDGLYVTDARWNERAKQMIQSGEYRYISPVFTYDSLSLQVLTLERIALTNNPALDGLTDLRHVAVATRGFDSQQGAHPAGSGMSERDEAIFVHSFGATPQQLQAKLDALNPPAPPPQGTSEEDWQKLRHVFGDTFLNQGGN